MSARPEETRDRLLVAARDLYLEGGEASFSLREVARRAGVSAAAVYRHFDGKEALLEAACAQGFALFQRYLLRGLAAPSAKGRLLAVGAQYRLFGLENPLDYQFIFMRTTPGPASDDLPQATTFRLLVDRVQECIDAKVLRRGRPEQLAVMIWAHVHGLVSLRIAGHLGPAGDDDAFAELFEGSVQALLRGLAP